jgi:hypothetical protein
MSVKEDMRMLRALVAKADELDETESDTDESNYQDKTRNAMRDMLDRMENGKLDFLNEKQRGYVRGVYEKVFQTPTYENLFSSGKAPRGKEVPTPAVLLNLPKRPPPRRPTQ